MGCGEYLDWLEAHRKQRRLSSPAEPGKPQAVSREETQHWLHEFGDIDADPEVRKFNRPYEDFDDQR